MARASYEPAPYVRSRGPTREGALQQGWGIPIVHETHFNIDNSGSHGSLFDSLPYYGFVMETPGDSGPCDSDPDGEMHTDA